MSILDTAVERLSGVAVSELRDTTLSERRILVEAEARRRTRFYSVFPIIGRGSVMRRFFVSHEEANSYLDKALQK